MRTGTKAFVVVGLLVTVVLAVFVSRFASDDPDGLEKVAAEEGFDEAADEHDLDGTPAADYAAGWSGLAGVVATFAIGAGVFAVVRRRRDRGGRDTERDAEHVG